MLARAGLSGCVHEQPQGRSSASRCFLPCLGTLAALGLVRGRLAGRALADRIVLAPLMLPQIILAIGMYPIMAKLGMIGTIPALIIAHTVVSMPLVFITVAAALRSYPPTSSSPP